MALNFSRTDEKLSRKPNESKLDLNNQNNPILKNYSKSNTKRKRYGKPEKNFRLSTKRIQIRLRANNLMEARRQGTKRKLRENNHI